MYSRGLASCSILVLATVAQGGVEVQLVPNPNLALYPPNSVVQVDVRLAQTGGGSDQRLRMVEFDLQATNAILLPGVTLPLTHNRGTPGTGDDIYFWYFGSLSACNSTPSACGLGHFIDDDKPAGPVDTRLNVLSIAFHGLTPNAQDQLLLMGNGTPVTVGKLQVTLPASAGTYTLNLKNQNDAGADRGARVDFGFDPHFTWRARNAPPNDVSNGILTFEVCPTNPCQGCEVAMDGWASVGTHLQGVGDVSLIIPDTGLFSEPRCGVRKIVVTVANGTLNPASVIPANVNVCGFDVNNSVVDLSGVAVSTATAAGDTKMEITFTTPDPLVADALPNFAKYKIALKGIQCSGGGALAAGQGGLSRTLTALQGDAGGGTPPGDRRITATDLGAVRGLVGVNPIDPGTLNHVRADSNCDGRINATDLGLIRGRVGQDARAILDPVCP